VPADLIVFRSGSIATLPHAPFGGTLEADKSVWLGVSLAALEILLGKLVGRNPFIAPLAAPYLLDIAGRSQEFGHDREIRTGCGQWRNKEIRPTRFETRPTRFETRPTASRRACGRSSA